MSTMTAPAREAVLPRNGFLKRYFYFAMSLVLAAIVISGFQRTVNDHLFHPAVPRPFILWIHGAAFAGWIAFLFFNPRWCACIKSAGTDRSDGSALGWRP